MIKPPERILDLEPLADHIAAHFPLMLQEMGDLLGRKLAVRRRDAHRAAAHVRRKLGAIRPYLIALEALGSGSNRKQYHYALIEGLLREYIRGISRKIRKTDDAFAHLLHVLEGWARLPKRAMRSTWMRRVDRAVRSIAARACVAIPHEELERFRSEWAQSKEGRRVVQMAVGAKAILRQFCQTPPKRLTTGLVHQLASEYRHSASTFEVLFRHLTSLLDLARQPKRVAPKPEGQTLGPLVRHAENDTDLAAIARCVNVTIRNDLSHGGLPAIDANGRTVTFHDRVRTEQWSYARFYSETKRLTAVTLVLMRLPTILTYESTRRVAEMLWLAATTSSDPGAVLRHASGRPETGSSGSGEGTRSGAAQGPTPLGEGGAPSE